jgi:hypothetical protein
LNQKTTRKPRKNAEIPASHFGLQILINFPYLPNSTSQISGFSYLFYTLANHFSPKPLIVKIQYKNFEPGEFTDVLDRSYDEAIRLIRDFPWERQRDHLQVSLTNPSVTIEDAGGDSLKLALFYNGKFVLHYFNNRQQLFTKSFTSYTDAFPYIRQFYADQQFDTTDFKLENTWMQANKIHFTNKEFRYSVTRNRIRNYLIGTSGINFLFTIFVIILQVYYHRELPIPAILVIFVTCFLIGGGLNLILFANYYHYAKGKMLIISKGHDQFWFGPCDNPEQFTKTEIMQVKRYCSPGTRNPVNAFAWVEIELKNARHLVIPNLLINDLELTGKLSEYPLETVKGFPSIPSSSPTPS